MVNKAKALGTFAETAAVRYLRDEIFPEAERRSLSGKYDKGDVNAHRDLVFEVKAVATPSFPGLLRETETERVNAGAKYGILVHKPVSVGKGNVRLWTAAILSDQFEELVRQGNSASIMHREFRRITGSSIRVMLSESSEMGKVLEPNTLFSAVNVLTKKGVEDYYVLYLEDMVTLLKRAGYGEKRDQ